MTKTNSSKRFKTKANHQWSGADLPANPNPHPITKKKQKGISYSDFVWETMCVIEGGIYDRKRPARRPESHWDGIIMV